MTQEQSHSLLYRLRLSGGLLLILCSLLLINLPSWGRNAMSHDRLCLEYQQPARNWWEALPLGKGFIGAMVYGGTTHERIDLNETTFWSGSPYNNDAVNSFATAKKSRPRVSSTATSSPVRTVCGSCRWARCSLTCLRKGRKINVSSKHRPSSLVTTATIALCLWSKRLIPQLSFKTV